MEPSPSQPAGPAPSGATAPRRAWIGLALAVALYTLLRALVLTTAFDSVCLTMYELYPMGTLARLIASGSLRVPLHAFYDNAAGQLTTGFLALPFYALLGPSYLALKLVPFTLGLAALIVLWDFVRVEFGRRAADLVALLFALAPGLLVRYSLKASGNHYENVFFTLLAVWALWRAQRPGAGAARLWLAGFAAGLALFVFLGAITPVGLLVLVHLGWVGWRRFARELAHLVPSFALGIAPLFLVNLGSGARGMSFLGAKFGGTGAHTDLGSVLRRCVEFFTVHLPASVCFPDWLGVPGVAIDRLFVALFALAWLLALPGALRSTMHLARGACGQGAALHGSARRDAVLAVLVWYVPLTALAYGLSNLRMGGHVAPNVDAGYRYFIPTWTFALILIGERAARTLASPQSGTRALGAALASLALGGAAFDWGLVDWSFERAGFGSHYEGSYVKQFARTLLGKKQAFDLDTIRAQAEALPPAFRCRVYEGLGYYRQLEGEVQGDFAALEPEAAARDWPPARRSDALRGAGSAVRDAWLRFGQEAQARALLERWLTQQPAGLEQALEGLALDWEVGVVRSTPINLADSLRILAALPPSAAAHVARGIGIDAGRLLSRRIDYERALLERLWSDLPQTLWAEFERGLGLGLVDGADEPRLDAGVAFLGARPPLALLESAAARIEALWGAEAGAEFARAGRGLPPGWSQVWSQVLAARR